MITYWKNDNGLKKVHKYQKDCWINVINPSQQEIQYLTEEFSIDPDFLHDTLDIDEVSRIEIEDQWLNIIVRIPIHNINNGLPFYTVPMGVIINKEMIITICQTDNEVISGLLNHEKNKRFDFENKINFFLHLFLRTNNVYLKFLKQINAHTNIVEKELEKSTRNKELNRLLKIEKCLVFFVTSLKSNEILLAKMRNTKFTRQNEFDEDMMDDLVIENRQAIEMANIYTDILAGLMDAFASVISNNMNTVMKELTIVTIILMIPNLIAGLFGMNVPNLLEHNNYAFLIILAASVGFALVGAYFFRRRNWF